MTLNLEAYQVIGLCITIVGAIWGTATAFFARFEASMKERDDGLKSEIGKLSEQMSKESEEIRKLDRDLLQLKADLPREYVSKNDFVRSFTVVEHKLDALANKIEIANIKVAMNATDDKG